MCDVRDTLILNMWGVRDINPIHVQCKGHINPKRGVRDTWILCVCGVRDIWVIFVVEWQPLLHCSINGRIRRETYFVQAVKHFLSLNLWLFSCAFSFFVSSDSLFGTAPAAMRLKISKMKSENIYCTSILENNQSESWIHVMHQTYTYESSIKRQLQIKSRCNSF